MSKTFWLLLFTYSINNLMAQSDFLDQYHWENRIILILNGECTADIYNNQMEEFSKMDLEFEERKLLVFQVQENRFRIVNQPDGKWVNSEKLFKKYNRGNQGFQIVLIGLDGGDKLRQDDVLSKKDLFDLIDSMPMRRAEMRRRH